MILKIRGELPDLSGYNGTSIVDGLKSVGYDSSLIVVKSYMQKQDLLILILEVLHKMIIT